VSSEQRMREPRGNETRETVTQGTLTQGTLTHPGKLRLRARGLRNVARVHCQLRAARLGALLGAHVELEAVQGTGVTARGKHLDARGVCEGRASPCHPGCAQRARARHLQHVHALGLAPCAHYGAQQGKALGVLLRGGGGVPARQGSGGGVDRQGARGAAPNFALTLRTRRASAIEMVRAAALIGMLIGAKKSECDDWRECKKTCKHLNF